MGISDLFASFLGYNEPTVTGREPPYPWPEGTTADDLYGTGIEGILARDDLSPEVKQQIANARMAARRSAVASLGMDPRRTAYVEGLAEDTGATGLYDPNDDYTYVEVGSPTTPVHEGIHRGFQQLREAGYSGQVPDRYEETIVRALMQNYFGDAEETNSRNVLGRLGEKYEGSSASEANADARMYKESQYFPEEMARYEALAAKEIARRRPGGPR